MPMIADEIQADAPRQAEYRRILTPEALAFLQRLQRDFNPVRLELLNARQVRRHELDRGVLPTFLAETAQVRSSAWQVAPAPADLQKRWVEITGPVDRKMMINALNSGADAFMADFEDSLSPTWDNLLQGQINLMDAVRGAIAFTSPEGKVYELGETTATLLVLGIIPGMSAFATWKMKQEMDKLYIPPIPEFIEMVYDAGAKLYACKATVDMFHLKKEDFCEQTDSIINVGKFYEIAAGGQIIFT